jgi:nucleoside-diphosphate-sugar epimerase
MKTAILTGATGFVGLNLLNELLNNNIFVYAIVRPGSKRLDRLLDKFGNNKNIRIILLDMADIDRLTKLDIKADTFYHCAWEGDRHSYEEQIKNMENSILAFNATNILNIKHFIGIGSQAEYGIYNHKIDEDKTCRPINAYGMCKLSTYRMLSNLSSYNNIKFTWVRLFSAYGKYDNHNTLIEQLINNLQKNQSIKIHSSEKKWEYIHIKDAVSALYLLGENVIEGLYNLSSGEPHLIKDFVEDVISIINPNIIIDYYNNYSEDETQIICNIDKIKSVIDWNPKINFKDGIKYGL